jgi:hypothetical protein
MAKKSKKDNKEKKGIHLTVSPKELVGSDDISFMSVLFNDLMNTMWLPEKISEDAVKLKIAAAQEILRQIAPQDGVEGMLAVQMASTHQAAMDCLRRAALQNQTIEGRNMALKHGEKLLRLYMDQVKALGKHRGQGDQKMTIEHVNVEPGGQAIVGQVRNKPQRKGKNDA